MLRCQLKDDDYGLWRCACRFSMILGIDGCDPKEDNFIIFYTLFFLGVQPRKCRVGLRDLPRGRRGDSLLHRDRLRHEEDRHQHTRHPLHEGLRS